MHLAQQTQPESAGRARAAGMKPMADERQMLEDADFFLAIRERPRCCAIGGRRAARGPDNAIKTIDRMLGRNS